MKLCSRCWTESYQKQTPLTDFDTIFNKKLFPNEPEHKKLCFRCRMSAQNNARTFKEFRRIEKGYYNIRYHIIAILSIVIPAFIVFLSLAAKELFNLDESSFAFLWAVCGLYMYGSQFYCGAKVVNNFFLTQKTPQEYWKTTQEGTASFSSDGTVSIDVHNVDHYSGGDNRPILLMIFLALFFGFWNIPYMLFFLATARMKLCKYCPKEVVDAWYYARANTKKIIIPKKVENKLYENARKKSTAINAINSKYFMLGEDVINEKIGNLKEFATVFKLKKKKYILISFNKDEYDRYAEKHFLLHLDENNSITGTVLIDGYPVHKGSLDWSEMWTQANGTQEIFTKLDRYKKILKA